MATKYTCPFEEECDTDCSQAEVGEFLRVTVNPRSRQVLSILEANEGDQILLGDLLEQLPVNGERDRRNWAIDLTHNYLPRLEDLGIVEYNRDVSVVKYLGCPLIDEPIEMVKAV